VVQTLVEDFFLRGEESNNGSPSEGSTFVLRIFEHGA